ncbi:hypothetical protein EJ04DRAFT_266147 [Polyplosphaeria fusca]|uniref:Uncharacterized protein n=1 Tax=Polyplosphaeria fusca TaxID=682080 RepID=A0A9P4V216_9PLEO|nr:hypothetical protein EJ04DRAFT_266147 [Polyplosphaeria fusca]
MCLFGVHTRECVDVRIEEQTDKGKPCRSLAHRAPRGPTLPFPWLPLFSETHTVHTHTVHSSWPLGAPPPRSERGATMQSPRAALPAHFLASTPLAQVSSQPPRPVMLMTGQDRPASHGEKASGTVLAGKECVVTRVADGVRRAGIALRSLRPGLTLMARRARWVMACSSTTTTRAVSGWLEMLAEHRVVPFVISGFCECCSRYCCFRGVSGCMALHVHLGWLAFCTLPCTISVDEFHRVSTRG